MVAVGSQDFIKGIYGPHKTITELVTVCSVSIIATAGTGGDYFAATVKFVIAKFS